MTNALAKQKDQLLPGDVGGSANKDLLVIESLNPLQLFTNNGLDQILQRIEQEAKSILLDISTEKGRKEVASLAYKIAQSKTALDKLGKDLVSGWKEQAKKVDAERARAWDKLEALQREIRAPLTEWEQKEKDRVAAHETALAEIDQLAVFDPGSAENCEVIEERIARSVELSKSRDWEEFVARARLAHDRTYDALVKRLEARRQYEAEQAELARLRQEAAERERREREERIAAEAAAKAKAEAEAKAKAEAEKAEQERQRILREKEESEARARKAEADAKAAAEKAERDRIIAAEKAKRDAEAAGQRERERIEAEKKAEAEAAAKREADKKHRAKINNEALDALLIALAGDNLLTARAAAKAVIEAIAKGTVPHVKISY